MDFERLGWWRSLRAVLELLNPILNFVAACRLASVSGPTRLSLWSATCGKLFTSVPLLCKSAGHSIGVGKNFAFSSFNMNSASQADCSDEAVAQLLRAVAAAADEAISP